MSEETSVITWKIGGEAGFGIMSTGEMFARACMRAGLNVYTYPEYPSLIRGGHNTVQVTASPQPLTSHRAQLAILVALNRETIDRHLSELSPQGVIIYDTTDRTFADFQPTAISRHDVQLLGLPMEKLAMAGGGMKLMRNTVALGASCALLDIPTDHLTEIIRDTFGHKGEAVVKLNVDVLTVGYQAVTVEQRQACPWSITPQPHPVDQVLLTGNEALALGAIQAGCQFFSGYPMTPATSILQYLAQHGPTMGIVVRHAEDEIGAVNHAIGAAYTGVRAMTATAGGGFSLMTEAVGMAAMTEIGIVIVEAQRGGPSTGLPTWTEQADLRQVLHASQGDFPRIVLTPSSHRECFTLMQEAFNLADLYQTPVIVMTDKNLAENYRNLRLDDFPVLPINRGKLWSPNSQTAPGAYLRYREDIPDGVAPRSLPGTPDGLFLANSDEHDEFGYSNEDIDHRLGQMNRRARKMSSLQAKVMPPRLYGQSNAPLTIVTWGSTAGAVEAAIDLVDAEHGLKANAVIITMLAPFPATAVTAQLKTSQRTVIVEGNQGGQLAGWIRQQTGLTFDHSINRYDGRPFDPVELADQLAVLLQS